MRLRRFVGTPRFAPFNVDLLAKPGTRKQRAEFDRMGRELPGKDR
ncbi:MAG TPA: hypothetical protein VKA16_05460 [Burkholderiales bacterium]|nr:hypothetical protein [Burkholderiales bacterium]